jgi:hypothetical protein
MALYISASRRFRRTLVIAVAAAVVAFAVGWLIGHQQVPSIADRVTGVQQDGESQATGLERLGIEYQQVLAGTDDLDSSVLQPLDDLRAELQSTMDRAPWLTSDERAAMLDAVSQVRQNAVDGVPLESFTASATAAAALIRQELGG